MMSGLANARMTRCRLVCRLFVLQFLQVNLRNLKSVGINNENNQSNQTDFY